MKKQFDININTLKEIGVDPDVIVKAIEQQKAIDLKPVHITAYFHLKRDLVSS